ncbi:hypothetical protein HPB48_014039 [Haemaphysalis longicornis]|uniref:Uncharacterized protein n=1 Tax=Haemaphysalis longicornis TaxID=44386 RepID=A0A9J6GTQ8_HAELO|nr:hypothetical protein HPB48_014039 [Haemaphysalis longicornis]
MRFHRKCAHQAAVMVRSKQRKLTRQNCNWLRLVQHSAFPQSSQTSCRPATSLDSRVLILQPDSERTVYFEWAVGYINYIA